MPFKTRIGTTLHLTRTACESTGWFTRKILAQLADVEAFVSLLGLIRFQTRLAVVTAT